jgi:hypothetical protein
MANSLEEFKIKDQEITYLTKGDFSVLFKAKSAENKKTKVIKFFPFQFDKIEEVRVVLVKVKLLDTSYIAKYNSIVFENNYLKELFEEIFDEEKKSY